MRDGLVRVFVPGEVQFSELFDNVIHYCNPGHNDARSKCARSIACDRLSDVALRASRSALKHQFVQINEPIDWHSASERVQY